MQLKITTDYAIRMILYLAQNESVIAVSYTHLDVYKRQEEEHEEHEEEIAHFHLRYGNESVEALMGVENWAPTDL